MKDLQIGFKATRALAARADRAAAAEGLSRADVARRALIRDLERMGVPQEQEKDAA